MALPDNEDDEGAFWGETRPFVDTTFSGLLVALALDAPLAVLALVTAAGGAATGVGAAATATEAVAASLLALAASNFSNDTH
jgi:hypothetical protein